MSVFTTTTSAANTSSLFDNTTSKVVVGELIFEKFIKKEDDDNIQIFDLQQDHESNQQQLDSQVVDEFFVSDDNLTPMFEFDDSPNSEDIKEWDSLFDNDIPITSEDVFNLQNEPLLKQEEKIEEQQQPALRSLEISSNSFLPTPIFEEAKLTTTQPKSGRVSKTTCSSKACSPKLDHLGVVSYNRKNRSIPLTPVIADVDDPVALKRARNTEAARRSRAKKMQRMNQLEERVEELLAKNSQLEQEVQRLTSLLNS